MNELLNPLSQVHQMNPQIQEELGLVFIFPKIWYDLNGRIGVVSKEGEGAVSIELPDVSFFDEADHGREREYKFFGETVLIAMIKL